MSPYIFGKRNSIHIIDIRETIKGLLRAKKFLSAIVSQGHDVLIVGTKRQAREAVEKQATRVGMHYVIERWLGGTLTNFKTIRSRLARLEELEELERSGRINQLTKKEKATIDREKRKIARNLEGIRRMTRLPGVLLIVDVKREHIAVKEAQKLGIPTICFVDTDSDPESADIIIPANDDAMRAIDLIMTQLGDAIEEGKRSRTAAPESDDGQQAGAPGARARRKRRTTSEQAEEGAIAPDVGGDEGGVSASAPMEEVAATGREVSSVQEVPDSV